MVPAVDAWLRHLSTRLDSARLTALHVDTPDGNISVLPCANAEYVCRIRFPGQLGERDIARTSIDRALALVQDQVVYGISFPPPYSEPDPGDYAPRDDHADGLVFRQVLPEGELRIVRHHDGFVGLLLLPNSLRLLGWSDDFETARYTSRQLIHTDATTRMSVRIHGRTRDLKLCSVPGVLAYFSTDDLSLLLVPGAPFVNADGLWDAPVTVIVIRGDHKPESAWTHPSFSALDGHNPIWSDEWAHRSHQVADPPPLEQPAPARPRAHEPSHLDPDVVALLRRYLDSLDHTEGDGQSMRQQLTPLLHTAAQSSTTDIRACGRGLRAELVARGGAPLKGSDRAFRHAIAYFHDQCPLLVRRTDSRDTVIAFSDLRPGTPLAAWIADKLAAHDPPPRSSTDRPPQHSAARHRTVLATCDGLHDPHAAPDADPDGEHDAPTPPPREPRPSAGTQGPPPTTDPAPPPPWVDEHNTLDIAASVAHYLGPPNSRVHAFASQIHAESRVPPSTPTGPPRPPGTPDPPPER